MGMTGSGKSSFIATCCPDAAGEIGHELESRTTKVQMWTFTHQGHQVHLVDTPGFDDTNRTDTDVLKDLAYWLGLAYDKKKIRLGGLIYLHPITHVRQEEDRYRRLRDTPEYWGDMIKERAHAHRHSGDRASAIKIRTPLMDNERKVPNLQKELVDEKKDLNRTEAGQEVNAEMNKQREALERRIDQTKEEMTKALALKDQKWVEELASDQEKYQRQINETKSAQEEMKLNMAKIFAEKEEQYKKSIKEMDDKLQDLEEKRQAREKKYEEERETARLEKQQSDQKAAKQEEEIDKARNEAEEAHQDKYMAQLTAIMVAMEKREAGEEERKQELLQAVAAAEARKESDMLAILKQAQRVKEEREQVAQRQWEHDQAMQQQQQMQFHISQAQAQAPAQAQAQY
ncbi:hypothetical protein JMJ35_009872 [Cladonia borealis]|uniref:G domain-containing protein n=1 Tax=Cladonia borealis TaxID=184061 RepID=A0AA39QUI7_9LECA|nr:hypothetical protein JMJ35_009872 [Cladonia borealis]